MSTPQTAILGPVPNAARFLHFQLTADAATPSGARDAVALVAAMSAELGTNRVIVGFGEPLVRALGARVHGLRGFPGISGRGVSIPSTQAALWVAIHGDDDSSALDRSDRALAALVRAFTLDEEVGAFVYDGGKDLTGYVDGTENPVEERAMEVALAVGSAGHAGGSFVAVQRWVHDLPRFRAWPRAHADGVIGRSRETNEELAEAPIHAHVKRSAQESFDPPAFMLRRSMPWAWNGRRGLYFIAYGATLDPFERVLRRMAGLDDEHTDGLFTFSHPETGSYFWCPPLTCAGGPLDLSVLGG
ncbi:MAG: Dyp-type peroxidase [Polyangiaceae bacterium]